MKTPLFASLEAHHEEKQEPGLREGVPKVIL